MGTEGRPRLARTRRPETGSPTAADVNVVADFGRRADYPLSKTKFAVFNSGIVPVATYERDANHFAEVKPESLRIDLGWGANWAGWSADPVGGTAAVPTYDFAEMDRIAAVLNARNVLPYWSYCYNPTPLQEPPGAWKSVPSDFKAWGRILAACAQHYRDAGASSPVGYHEIFNEPDNADFTVGTIDDYFAMYDHGAVAIREADPDALVGGPALAFTRAWIDPFLDHVAEHGLPLDFFSTHLYGTNDMFERLGAMLDASADGLDRHPAFVTTELHLNEFNSYPIDYPIDGSQQKHPLAAAFLRDMDHLLARPEVTVVHWAQFLDSGQNNFSGMVSIDGHRKAVFNAAEIYARLPVDRSPVTIDGAPDLGGLAAADGHRAALVLWNLALGTRSVALRLKDVPTGSGTLRVYRVDAEHASWGDGSATETLVAVETRREDDPTTLAWSGDIPGGGVVYLELDDDSGLSDLRPNRVARWLRTLHYYPDRKTTAYADFDKNTWIFRLGMATEQAAHVEIGVTAEGWPDVLRVTVELDDAPRRLDADSLLGLRVDYRVDGAYATSVLVHGPWHGVDLFDSGRTSAIPWGTRRPPDRTVAVDALAAFDLPMRVLAPANWDGRAQLSATLQNAGVGTRAKICLRRG